MNDDLKNYLDARFNYLDEQFNGVNSRLDGVELKLDALTEQVATNTVLLTEHSDKLIKIKKKLDATYDLVGEHETKLAEF